jgi:lipoyl(octanoyl) transferase
VRLATHAAGGVELLAEQVHWGNSNVFNGKLPLSAGPAGGGWGRCFDYGEGRTQLMARFRHFAHLYDLPNLTPYPLAHAWQRSLFAERVVGAAAAASAAPPRPPAAGAPFCPQLPHVVLALEHPPVFTLGRAASLSDLTFSASAGGAPLGEDAPLPAPPPGFSVHRVERGGKVTYHGPGQLVVYPVLDLRSFGSDLHWYVHSIEEVVIRALAAGAGVAAFRLRGAPGVWTGAPGRERKIAAVGMHASRWVTQHGFAVNVAPRLDHFSHIVPCGIRDRAVTSVAREWELRGGGGGAPPTVGEFKVHALRAFEEVFDMELQLQEGTPPGGAGAGSE